MHWVKRESDGIFMVLEVVVRIMAPIRRNRNGKAELAERLGIKANNFQPLGQVNFGKVPDSIDGEVVFEATLV
jgi:hypothetical protein